MNNTDRESIAAKMVDYIVCYAVEHDINLTTVRLVKFLYLSDLYYARSNKGQTLSGFPWRFVHYGPFCTEALDVIDQAANRGSIVRKRISSNYLHDDFFVYGCPHSLTNEMKNAVPEEIVSFLNEAIRELGEDTAALLDYVYFATEPMEDVTAGQVLDFSKARPVLPTPDKPPTIRFTKEETQKLKEHLGRLAVKAKNGQRTLLTDRSNLSKWKDDLYYRTLNDIEEEELPPGITGIAKLME